MPHEDARAHAHERVQRVLALGVHMIQPGGKHAERPQLTPMFVRDEVVRIVGPRAGIFERADPLPLDSEARQSAIRAVRVSGGVRQHAIDVCGGHRALFPALIFESS